MLRPPPYSSAHLGCWLTAGRAVEAGGSSLPLWLSQTSSQLSDSGHLPRLNEACCHKPTSCHSSAPPQCHLSVPVFYLSVHSTHLWRMFPMGLLAGSHTVWATSLNTEIPAHAICPGPTSMIPSLETSGRIGSMSVPTLSSSSRQETPPRLLHIPRGAPFHRLPPELGHQVGTQGPRTEGVKGQRISAIPVTVTSSELPSKEAN